MKQAPGHDYIYIYIYICVFHYKNVGILNLQTVQKSVYRISCNLQAISDTYEIKGQSWL